MNNLISLADTMLAADDLISNNNNEMRNSGTQPIEIKELESNNNIFIYKDRYYQIDLLYTFDLKCWLTVMGLGDLFHWNSTFRCPTCLGTGSSGKVDPDTQEKIDHSTIGNVAGFFEPRTRELMRKEGQRVNNKLEKSKAKNPKVEMRSFSDIEDFLKCTAKLTLITVSPGTLLHGQPYTFYDRFKQSAVNYMEYINILIDILIKTLSNHSVYNNDKLELPQQQEQQQHEQQQEQQEQLQEQQEQQKQHLSTSFPPPIVRDVRESKRRKMFDDRIEELRQMIQQQSSTLMQQNVDALQRVLEEQEKQQQLSEEDSGNVNESDHTALRRQWEELRKIEKDRQRNQHFNMSNFDLNSLFGIESIEVAPTDFNCKPKFLLNQRVSVLYGVDEDIDCAYYYSWWDGHIIDYNKKDNTYRVAFKDVDYITRQSATESISNDRMVEGRYVLYTYKADKTHVFCAVINSIITKKNKKTLTIRLLKTNEIIENVNPDACYEFFIENHQVKAFFP
ncbi:hypothetical protein PPL_00304 [Heterostelium album PN500]|uniref:Uncharacterized protein n=1 Tax=Heterostelium pallidum (strain ATCC 26659 / Pp 5 / PN500) TaxID=670386 RepID=D3AW36_HETP5|nr:hypothetical protein PPL_00304 [Heterostelium album PN500]EFA86509.1 hypothetical protein PPL_00304 [Heterostelium album PN500]|eukprot:XP_020438614.1 hypothetical protein PPL_00304 [Heterostelium album PN500]